jgi:hypothetical protein
MSRKRRDRPAKSVCEKGLCGIVFFSRGWKTAVFPRREPYLRPLIHTFPHAL